MTTTIQNFSVARNTDNTVPVTVLTAIPNDSLVGTTITWSVYKQSYGIITDDTPIFSKTSATSGGITIPPSPPTAMEFDITIARTDLGSLAYGNYYHEATVVDEIGNQVAVVCGVMAVTVGANV